MTAVTPRVRSSAMLIDSATRRRLSSSPIFFVAARMEIESVETEGLASRHLAEERLARFGESLGLGMAQVDKVAVVRQDLRRRVAALAAGVAERFDLRLGECGSGPLALVFGEKGECRSPYVAGVARSVFHAARSAYVRAEIFHKQNCLLYLHVSISERSDRSPLRGGDLEEGQICKCGQRPQVMTFGIEFAATIPVH